MFGPRQRMLAPALHAPDLLAGERGAEYVLAHQILLGSEQIGLVLDLATEIAQDLHGALIGDVRPRRVRQPAVAIDHHVVDAVRREQCGTRRTGRSGTNDQNVGADVSHAVLPCISWRSAHRARCGGRGKTEYQSGWRTAPTGPAARTASR